MQNKYRGKPTNPARSGKLKPGHFMSATPTYLRTPVHIISLSNKATQSTSIATSTCNLNTTANASSSNRSSSRRDLSSNEFKSVSLEQIKALELKIASLNEQIAQIMHRSVETQEDIVNTQAKAL